MAQASVMLNPKIGAIVLCGGLSVRMGRSKALLPFGSEALAARVARQVRRAVGGKVVVVAAQDQELPELVDRVEIVRDRAVARGPLEGFATGLEAIGSRCEFVYLTATDAPFLAHGWINCLHALIGSSAAAVPFIGGRHAPLAALYRPEAVRSPVARLLESNQLRLLLLLEEITVRNVLAEEFAAIDPTGRTLRNVNTPEEYLAALAEEDEI